jgi:polar amino acid transport system substrate-binding protein
MKRLTGIVVMLVAGISVALGATTAGASGNPPLRLATVLTYPPYGYKAANGTPTGFEIALARVLAKRMGRKLQISNVGFPALIPGLQNNRYDMVMAALGDSLSRQKQVDFVIYARQPGDALLEKTGNPAGIQPSNLCGHSLAALEGTLEASFLPTYSAACVKAGQEKVDIQDFPQFPPLVLAINSGRIAATPVSPAYGRFIVKQSGGSLALSKQLVKGFAPLNLGIAVKKGNPLSRELETELNAMMKDGTYAKIMKQFNVTDHEIKHSAIDEPSPVDNIVIPKK